MPRLVVISPDVASGEQLARHLGAADGMTVVTFHWGEAAMVAQAREDVVILSPLAGAGDLERLAALIRGLADDAPAAPRTPAFPVSERLHRLANHLAGVATALLLLEHQLGLPSTEPAATLRAARAYVKEIAAVMRAGLALWRQPPPR